MIAKPVGMRAYISTENANQDVETLRSPKERDAWLRDICDHADGRDTKISCDGNKKLGVCLADFRVLPKVTGWATPNINGGGRAPYCKFLGQQARNGQRWD
jgi:hypothetical protein